MEKIFEVTGEEGMVASVSKGAPGKYYVRLMDTEVGVTVAVAHYAETNLEGAINRAVSWIKPQGPVSVDLI